MRVAVIAAVAVLGLMALPAPVQAAPAALHGLALSTPAIELVAGGCGAGWHPQRWRDRWGKWHRRCVPNRW
jgi:peptidoglycan/LPS O-acetylase OafA/YrhL